MFKASAVVGSAAISIDKNVARVAAWRWIISKENFSPSSSKAKRRMMRPRKSGEETEADIIRTAISEFADKGYDAASMREIARLSGITTPTIYLYFADKKSLYAAACRSVFHRSTEQIERAIRRNGQTPEEALKAYINAVCSIMIDDHDATRLFARELIEKSEDILGAMGKQEFLAPFNEIVIILAKLGVVDPRETAAAIYGTALGLSQYAHLFRVMGEPPLAFQSGAPAMADFIYRVVIAPRLPG